MNRLVIAKGCVIDAADADVWSVSAGVLHGKGIFTTLAVVGSAPLLWEKHWQRLVDNAARTGIDVTEYSKAGIREALDEIISVNGLTDGRARITLVDESPASVWPFDHARKTSLFMITGGVRSKAEILRLTISPYRVNSHSPLAGVKSCNYLENVIAYEEANGRGFHEAIRLNERGHVTGGCMSNVFWSKGGELFTPSRATGCLQGTTREHVLENLECSEVEQEIDALNDAEVIFLTSAGVGIVSVGLFDAITFETCDHPMLGLWPPY